MLCNLADLSFQRSKWALKNLLEDSVIAFEELVEPLQVDHSAAIQNLNQRYLLFEASFGGSSPYSAALVVDLCQLQVCRDFFL